MKVRTARPVLRAAHRTKMALLILVATIQKPKLIARGKLTPVTITELEGFLAVVINMGIISVPVVEDYWKMSWIAEVSFFSRLMARDCFTLIFWMSATAVSPCTQAH